VRPACRLYRGMPRARILDSGSYLNLPATPRGPRITMSAQTIPSFASGSPVLRLPVRTLPQPDETTCGPTCLHAVYAYWGDKEPLDTVVARMWRLRQGGTFAVFLGCDALRKGYRARIYTYNLTVFDPTWFTPPHVDIAGQLALQR